MSVAVHRLRPVEHTFGSCCGHRAAPPVAKGRLREMERSKKRLDALMMSFSAYMADRKPKPLRRETRYNYRGRVERCMKVAQEGGYSLLAGDVRVLRYVLGRFSPHPSTQTGYMAALQMFYEFLQHQGLRKDNPAKTVGRPPKMRYLPRPLPADACVRYEAAAVELGPAHEWIAVAGLYQGFRRNETRTAKWTWFFQADGRTWCDVTGKGGIVGRVAVHERTVELLGRLRREHNDPEWILPSPTVVGAPIGGTWVSAAHKRILALAGLEADLVLHQLRHSYATYLRAAGADLSIVQRGLRHASTKSTEIYMQVFPTELAEAQEKLRYGVTGMA
jgi:integrase/recombinase XerD